MTKHDILKMLVRILDAYQGKSELVSNQGQAMDGYAALANFVDVAKKARTLLEE